MQSPGTRLPLSGTVDVGLGNLKRLGLTAEAGTLVDLATIGELRDVTISGHAPISIGEMRLNIAAIDDDFRETSISHLTAYIDSASRLPNLRQVNIHFAPKRWLDETQTAGREGDYDRLIDRIRRLGSYAAERELEIVLENGNAYWTGIGDDVPEQEVDWDTRNVGVGAGPEEWAQVCEDVGHPSVGLCLDSSHTSTYAHMFPEAERERVVMRFLAKPHLIRHVHWSDNFLYDVRGRTDSHASVGKGSMPTQLHRGIKGLNATILLEHFYTIEELEEELEYIASL